MHINAEGEITKVNDGTDMVPIIQSDLSINIIYIYIYLIEWSAVPPSSFPLDYSSIKNLGKFKFRLSKQCSLAY